MMSRHYYAAQSPRGFGNEITVYRFPSRSARDDYVRQHKDDGGSNSAALGAYAVTAREAHRIANWPGNATTHSYNVLRDCAGSR